MIVTLVPRELVAPIVVAFKSVLRSWSPATASARQASFSTFISGLGLSTETVNAVEAYATKMYWDHPWSEAVFFWRRLQAFETAGDNPLVVTDNITETMFRTWDDGVFHGHLNRKVSTFVLAAFNIFETAKHKITEGDALRYYPKNQRLIATQGIQLAQSGMVHYFGHSYKSGWMVVERESQSQIHGSTFSYRIICHLISHSYRIICHLISCNVLTDTHCNTE